MLNSRKGPAVWGPRAQADRDLYKEQMLRTMEAIPNLKIIEASVEDILLDDIHSRIRGIKTTDSTWYRFCLS
jgi:tRNA uridine 5-carboxymethylaminomethyl modification enzyme